MSRYLISAVEQALWSLLNFGVNLLLIRFVAPEQYGAFVFWAAVGFMLSSLQNALTVCHLQVLPPGDGTAPERLAVERLMHGVNLVFLLATGAIVLAGALAWRAGGNPYGAPAAALFVPAYLLQQYVRALVFSRGKADQALVQTACVFALSVALLSATVARSGHVGADAILLALGAAYGLVGVVGMVRASRGQHRWWASGRDLVAYGDYARQSGWVFLGVSSTELLTRFYVFVAAGAFGPATLAALTAAQQLLRPIPLLASSWSMVARADLARLRDAGDWRRFVGMVLVALAGGSVIAGAWTLIIHEAWPLVATHLFGGKYLDAAWMVPLWGLASTLGFGQAVVSAAIQSLRAFKALALANTAASLVAAAAILAMIQGLGAAGAIIGTAAGQALELVVMAAILAGTVAARKRSGSVAP